MAYKVTMGRPSKKKAESAVSPLATLKVLKFRYLVLYQQWCIAHLSLGSFHDGDGKATDKVNIFKSGLTDCF